MTCSEYVRRSRRQGSRCRPQSAAGRAGARYPRRHDGSRVERGDSVRRSPTRAGGEAPRRRGSVDQPSCGHGRIPSGAIQPSYHKNSTLHQPVTASRKKRSGISVASDLRRATTGKSGQPIPGRSDTMDDGVLSLVGISEQGQVVVPDMHQQRSSSGCATSTAAAYAGRSCAAQSATLRTRSVRSATTIRPDVGADGQASRAACSPKRSTSCVDVSPIVEDRGSTKARTNRSALPPRDHARTAGTSTSGDTSM